MSVLYEKYLAKVGELSEVKLKILKILWRNDFTLFPKPWISSRLLLKATNQKYFDRRTRELRDENGCDIETRQIEGVHCYRLKSDKVGDKNPRGYLSPTEKEKLFNNYKHTCQICGRKYEKNQKGLQADHKVPLSRKGSHILSNWQPICVECNVGKRRACEGCSDNCNSCSWAFPEKVGKIVALKIPTEILDKLSRLSLNSQKQIQERLVEIIKKGI